MNPLISASEIFVLFVCFVGKQTSNLFLFR